jgi:hypothetical protein
MRKLKLASKIPGFSFKLAVVRKMESPIKREKIPTKRIFPNRFTVRDKRKASSVLSISPSPASPCSSGKGWIGA